MKQQQLIFCVETNQQSDTDFQYIMSAIRHFYQCDNAHTKINPVYLGGKGGFSTNKTVRKINSLINQYKAGSPSGNSFVFLCLDCDNYDSSPEDLRILSDAKQYCEGFQNYRLIWFCRDVEDVFLGHQVSSNQKRNEANRFVTKCSIEQIQAERFMAEKYRAHHSNLCLVLNQFLEPREKTG